MRLNQWLMAAAVVLALAQLTRADCGKVVVLSCPEGTTPEDFLKKIQGGGNVAPDLTGGGTTQPTKPDDTSGSSGDGAVTTDPVDGDQLQTISGTRSYFAEPAQRAVIAWNGKEEILVLKTEERSLVGKGAMLSFLPLPGKPIDVRKADQKLFDRAYDLVQKKLEKEGVKVNEVTSSSAVLIERTIGAHNIFVWRIDSAEDFARKVQEYVRRRFGARAVAVFSKDTERVVKEYYRDGYRYFAFDLLAETDQEHSEKVAIEYHFESPFVYYPLRDSQSGGGGETRVELVVFTDAQGVNANKGKVTFADEENRNGDILTLGKTSVTVTGQEVEKLHPGMARLFDGRDVRGRIWVLRGPLAGFNGDVQAFYKK